MRNCASGMQAIDSAIDNIRAGRSNLVLAGGVDALSRAPLLFSDAMVMWLSQLVRGEDARPARGAARAVPARLPRAGDRPHEGADRSDRRPADGPDGGEPRVSASASRAREMDEFARAQPRARAARRRSAGHFAREIVPLYDSDGQRSTRPTTACARIRRRRTSPSCGRSSTASTATSPPATARRSPTARAWLVLASERAVDAAQARRRRAASSIRNGRGSIPAQMGLGPGARGDADPAAPRPRPRRPRCVGDQRGVRRAGASPASARGRATTYCRERARPAAARSARSTRRSSTSTAARSRSAIRSAPRARASCCTC